MREPVFVDVNYELGVTLSPDTNLLEAIHAIENELALEHPRRAWLLLSVCRLFMLLVCESGGSRLMAGYMQRSQRDMAQAVYQQIVENTGTPAELASLAGRFGVSEASLRSYFSRVYGQTPAAFARTHALNEAARLLAQTDQPIAQVSQACGYANPSKFSAAFCHAHGINPLEYRRRSRLA